MGRIIQKIYSHHYANETIVSADTFLNVGEPYRIIYSGDESGELWLGNDDNLLKNQFIGTILDEITNYYVTPYHSFAAKVYIKYTENNEIKFKEASVEIYQSSYEKISNSISKVGIQATPGDIIAINGEPIMIDASGVFDYILDNKVSIQTVQPVHIYGNCFIDYQLED